MLFLLLVLTVALPGSTARGQRVYIVYRYLGNICNNLSNHAGEWVP